jgi:hypothetical protein
VKYQCLLETPRWLNHFCKHAYASWGVHRTACNIWNQESVVRLNMHFIRRMTLGKKLINKLNTTSWTLQINSIFVKSTIFQLDILCIYGNRKSITVFTTARHLSLPRSRSIRFSSRHACIRSILILHLPCYLRLGSYERLQRSSG